MSDSLEGVEVDPGPGSGRDVREVLEPLADLPLLSLRLIFAALELGVPKADELFEKRFARAGLWEDGLGSIENFAELIRLGEGVSGT